MLATWGISPVRAECAAGRPGNCTNITFGAIEPGLQSGFATTPAAAGRR
ncbi:MAG: hypothetical protein R2699_05420 [Acidimicrobiales bacterium]